MQVTKEDPKKALDDQFGGEDDSIPPPNNPQLVRFPRFSNAYMLVYIRESDWPHVRLALSWLLRVLVVLKLVHVPHAAGLSIR
jgi:hypothetical protein